MKFFMKTSALALTGALLIAACGNKEQKDEANVNENPVEEKVEVKAVEGRKNFSDKAVITPLPAIMIATWDEKQNPDVMMAAWGGTVRTEAHHIRTLQAQDYGQHPLEEGLYH